MNYEMITTVSAIAAAYVGAFKVLKWVPNKYLPFISVAFAEVFFVVPTSVYNLIVPISMAGLGAAGVYHMATKDGAK
jgi:hypothetical protein